MIVSENFFRILSALKFLYLIENVLIIKDDFIFEKRCFAIIRPGLCTPVVGTRDALADRLQRVRESVSLLYNRFKQRAGYGQTLQDTVEEEAERDHVEEPQEDDDGIETNRRWESSENMESIEKFK